MKICTKTACWTTLSVTILVILANILIYLFYGYSRNEFIYNQIINEVTFKGELMVKEKLSGNNTNIKWDNKNNKLDLVNIWIYDNNFDQLYGTVNSKHIVKNREKINKEIIDKGNTITIFENSNHVVILPLTVKDKTYYVVASSFDNQRKENSDLLLATLIAFGIIFILITFVISYIFTKKALVPLSNISHQIRDMKNNDLSRRIDIPKEKDETIQLAVEINEALDSIEASIHSQKMFVSNVSHELRTPLAALIGEIDITLLKERKKDEYKETLATLRRDAIRMRRLTNDLLDLSRANNNGVQLSKDELRLDELLLDAREIILKEHKGYNIDIQFLQFIEEDSDITIRGNEYLLKLAFANIMENNCKFSKEKKSMVRIAFLDNMIEIIFSDRGIGIPKKDIENIFQPFYRGINRNYAEGYGIGMALVDRVVKLHNGSISVESVEGEYTSFKVNFPTE